MHTLYNTFFNKFLAKVSNIKIALQLLYERWFHFLVWYIHKINATELNMIFYIIDTFWTQSSWKIFVQKLCHIIIYLLDGILNILLESSSSRKSLISFKYYKMKCFGFCCRRVRHLPTSSILLYQVITSLLSYYVQQTS
jgi:hypothetical protein